MSMRYAKTKGQLNKRIDDRIYKPRREAMSVFDAMVSECLSTGTAAIMVNNGRVSLVKRRDYYGGLVC